MFFRSSSVALAWCRSAATCWYLRKMAEPEAYRWLQKKAMNENRKLAQVVKELVERHDADAAATQVGRKQP